MRAPAFWWRPPGLAASLLQPVSTAYGAVAGRRMARPGARAAIPVVCVGNMTVGGAGKTPTSIRLADTLRALGLTPAFLTRGYGGALTGPLLVDPARHGFREVGDEALLLARHASTIVSRARPAGAALAVSIGADVIVMDDGLQNPSLAKDLAVAVFDSTVGIGNGLIFPAGPLRAPLSAQWPRIDAVFILGEGAPGRVIADEASRRGLPTLKGSLQPAAQTADRLRGSRVLAFAGIGRPEKFYTTLRELGATVVKTRSFPDHHPFRADEVNEIIEAARRDDLIAVTTEKDAVRLAGYSDGNPHVSEIVTLPVSLQLSDQRELEQQLRQRILERISPS